MKTSKPVVEYRTLRVQSTDPSEDPTVEQQCLITWEEINFATIASEGDTLSIVYTADTRDELLRFLSRLKDAL